MDSTFKENPGAEVEVLLLHTISYDGWGMGEVGASMHAMHTCALCTLCLYGLAPLLCVLQTRQLCSCAVVQLQSYLISDPAHHTVNPALDPCRSPAHRGAPARLSY